MRLRLRVTDARRVDFPRRILLIFRRADQDASLPQRAGRVPVALGMGAARPRGPRYQPVQLPETSRGARGHPHSRRQTDALHPGVLRRTLAVLRLRQRARVRLGAQVFQGRGERPAVGGRVPERPPKRRDGHRGVPRPSRHRVHRSDGLADDLPRELAGGDRADGPRGAPAAAVGDATVLQHADTRQAAARDGDRGDHESHRGSRRQSAKSRPGDDGAQGGRG